MTDPDIPTGDESTAPRKRQRKPTAKETAKARERRFAEDVRLVAETPRGRRILAWLLEPLDRLSPSTNHGVLCHFEGQRFRANQIRKALTAESLKLVYSALIDDERPSTRKANEGQEQDDQ